MTTKKPNPPPQNQSKKEEKQSKVFVELIVVKISSFYPLALLV
jgi:hypothetical protein